MSEYVDNILSVWHRATDADREGGMAWYREAQRIAMELSPGDVWKGAGVIAALSPLKQWPLNLRLAREAFATGVAAGNIGQHNEKAQRILDGEPALDVLPAGKKTHAFAAAIATGGETDITTIDRHAYDVALAKVHTDATRKIGARIYRELDAAYHEAARIAGVSIHELQAVTWVTWRREKGIKE